MVTTKLMCVLVSLFAVLPVHAQDALRERLPAPTEARIYGLQLRATEYGELRTAPCSGYCPYCGNCYSYPTWSEQEVSWQPSAVDSAWRAARMKEWGQMITALIKETQAHGDSLRETEQ